MTDKEQLVTAPHDRVVRMHELKALLGLSKPTIYELIKKNQFDPGFKLGTRSRGWRLSTVMAWLDKRQLGSKAV